MELSMNFRLSEAKKKYEGLEFTNNSGDTCVVETYINAKEVYVSFNGEHYVKPFRIGNLVRGEFVNLYAPKVRGVGYLGIGKFTAKDKLEYQTWTNMLKRAYDDKTKEIQPSYKYSSVCEEWHNFQNFAEWCNNQIGFGAVDRNGKFYQLDKDLIFLDSKVYSPESCCFIPQCVNLAISKRVSVSKYPTGVCFDKKAGKFIASITKFGRHEFLGYFGNVEEAFQTFKVSKESYVAELAGEWKEYISEKAYKALLNYKATKETEYKE